MLFLSALVALAASQTVLAGMISPRSDTEGNVCRTPQTCFHFYKTGSAQCSAGYTRTNLEAKGDPLGSYCERKCTATERTSCTATQCSFYEKECHLYPAGKNICKSAIEWCKGPVAMLATICTDQVMGQAVTYDQGKHVCFPKGTSATSRKFTPLTRGTGAAFLVSVSDPSIKYKHDDSTCRPTSYTSCKNIEKAVLKNTNCKTILDENKGNTGYDFVSVECKLPLKDWATIASLVSSECGKAESWDNKKPHFQTMKFA
jgi:hypothetical protein